MTSTHRYPVKPRRLEIGDKRSPMRRFLEGVDARGYVFVQYHEQWRTLSKAERLGYIDGNQFLLDAGKQFLASEAL